MGVCGLFELDAVAYIKLGIPYEMPERVGIKQISFIDQVDVFRSLDTEELVFKGAGTLSLTGFGFGGKPLAREQVREVMRTERRKGGQVTVGRYTTGEIVRMEGD